MFTSIRVGDEVEVRAHRISTGVETFSKATVKKVTSTSVWLDKKGFRRFRRDNGNEIGGGGSYITMIRPVEDQTTE